MARSPYPTFAQKFKAALGGRALNTLAASTGIAGEKLEAYLAGTEIPDLHVIKQIANELGVAARPLMNAAMDDVAAPTVTAKPPKKTGPVTTGSSRAANQW